jgi:hypothetical protein
MRSFEEGILKALTIGSWDIIVHLVKPSVPFGWNSVSIGTPDRKEVVILDPSALIKV